LDLDLFGWVVVAVCAVMVGTTKTGMPGLGILIVPLMALVLPTRQSTGILLGILILADLFAITYHRRNARWGHVLRLLPAAFAGIVAGYVPIPTQWWFAVALGFMAGVTTMMANAAGPVMIIYLLAMRLPKVEFVGTGAWFFFVVNWLKVPFSANLNLMTAESVKLNLMMLPFIKAFNVIVQILAAAAAIKLLF